MNCVNQIIEFLKLYPNTEPIHKALQGQVESQVDRLSSEQSSWLVAQLGIGHIYTILHEKIEDPLSTVPGMDAASLKIFVVSHNQSFCFIMSILLYSKNNSL